MESVLERFIQQDYFTHTPANSAKPAKGTHEISRISRISSSSAQEQTELTSSFSTDQERYEETVRKIVYSIYQTKKTYACTSFEQLVLVERLLREVIEGMAMDEFYHVGIRLEGNEVMLVPKY